VLPLPLVADVTVSQLALLDTVHGQPEASESAVVPLPPVAGTFALVGLKLKEQPDA